MRRNSVGLYTWRQRYSLDRQKLWRTRYWQIKTAKWVISPIENEDLSGEHAVVVKRTTLPSRKGTSMRNMTVAVVLAAFTAVSSQAQEYARLYDLTIDGDSVHVSPDIARTGGAGVTICLRNASAWNKGIGRAGGRWSGFAALRNRWLPPARRMPLRATWWRRVTARFGPTSWPLCWNAWLRPPTVCLPCSSGQ